MKNKKAFTLAELLITLTTIGIISALTIPAISQRVTNYQIITSTKQAYSILDQATKRIILNNGSTFKGLCPNDDGDCVAELYKPYFNYAKYCPDGASLGKCWHLNDGSVTGLDGVPKTGWGDFSSFVLNNGMLLQISHYRQYCDYQWASPLKFCSVIVIDSNGFKGPNVWGKDILHYYIVENGIKPFGTVGCVHEGNCDPAGDYQGCTAKYLLQ